MTLPIGSLAALRSLLAVRMFGPFAAFCPLGRFSLPAASLATPPAASPPTSSARFRLVPLAAFGWLPCRGGFECREILLGFQLVPLVDRPVRWADLGRGLRPTRVSEILLRPPPARARPFFATRGGASAAPAGRPFRRPIAWGGPGFSRSLGPRRRLATSRRGWSCRGHRGLGPLRHPVVHTEVASQRPPMAV